MVWPWPRPYVWVGFVSSTSGRLATWVRAVAPHNKIFSIITSLSSLLPHKSRSHLIYFVFIALPLKPHRWHRPIFIQLFILNYLFRVETSVALPVRFIEHASIQDPESINREGCCVFVGCVSPCMGTHTTLRKVKGGHTRVDKMGDTNC